MTCERGMWHRGSFGGEPVRIAIGGVMPALVKQIETARGSGAADVRRLVRELVETTNGENRK